MTDINYFLQHPNHLIKFTHYRKHNPDNIITGIAVIAKQNNKDTDDFQMEHGIYINDIKLCVI
jgi:hypothetical protein